MSYAPGDGFAAVLQPHGDQEELPDGIRRQKVGEYAHISDKAALAGVGHEKDTSAASSVADDEESTDAPVTIQPAASATSQKQSSAPLGSSENPIQIIQQGNTYHSTQVLSPEQLQQIAHVLQQQQVNLRGPGVVVLDFFPALAVLCGRLPCGGSLGSRAGRKKGCACASVCALFLRARPQS